MNGFVNNDNPLNKTNPNPPDFSPVPQEQDNKNSLDEKTHKLVVEIPNDLNITSGKNINNEVKRSLQTPTTKQTNTIGTEKLGTVHPSLKERLEKSIKELNGYKEEITTTKEEQKKTTLEIKENKFNPKEFNYQKKLLGSWMKLHNLKSKIINFQKSLNELKKESSPESKKTLNSIEHLIQECVILEDKCQSSIKYYAEIFHPSPFSAVKDMEKRVKSSPEDITEKDLKELTRRAQYLANTLEDQDGIRSMIKKQPTMIKAQNKEGKNIKIPEQLSKDLDRSHFEINGKTIKKMNDEVTKYEIAEKIEKEFGSGSIKVIGQLMHQGLGAVLIEELVLGRKVDGRQIELPLGFGSTELITDSHQRKLNEKFNKKDAPEIDFCPVQYNLQKNRNGDVIITQYYITGFISTQKPSPNPCDGVYCTISTEVTIPKEDLFKAPEEMNLTVKGSVSDFVQGEEGLVKLFNIGKKDIEETEEIKNDILAKQFSLTEINSQDKVKKVTVDENDKEVSELERQLLEQPAKTSETETLSSNHQIEETKSDHEVNKIDPKKNNDIYMTSEKTTETTRSTFGVIGDFFIRIKDAIVGAFESIKNRISIKKTMNTKTQEIYNRNKISIPSSINDSNIELTNYEKEIKELEKSKKEMIKDEEKLLTYLNKTIRLTKIVTDLKTSLKKLRDNTEIKDNENLTNKISDFLNRCDNLQAQCQSLALIENFEKPTQELTKTIQHRAETYEGAEILDMLQGKEIDVELKNVSNENETIKVPMQLYKDLSRSRIAINGEVLLERAKSNKDEISKNDQNYQVAKGLKAKFSEQEIYKLGHLLHQGLFTGLQNEIGKGRLVKETLKTTPLGIGILGSISPTSFENKEFGALTESEKIACNERFSRLGPAIFNIEIDNSTIVIKSSMTHRFNGPMESNQLESYYDTFCILNMEITIPIEEFKKDPKYMKVQVKASSSEIIKGVGNLEKLFIENERLILGGSKETSEVDVNKEEKVPTNEEILNSIKERGKEIDLQQKEDIK